MSAAEPELEPEPPEPHDREIREPQPEPRDREIPPPMTPPTPPTPATSLPQPATPPPQELIRVYRPLTRLMWLDEHEAVTEARGRRWFNFAEPQLGWQYLDLAAARRCVRALPHRRVFRGHSFGQQRQLCMLIGWEARPE